MPGLALVDETGGGEFVDERSVHFLVEIEIEFVGGAIGVAEARELVAALEEAILAAPQFVTDEGGDQTPLTLVESAGTPRRAIDIAAEFVQGALKSDSNVRRTINSMVEALVLYRVAFLPDVSASARKFTNLRVLL